MGTSKKRWNKLLSIILAAAMICSVLTPTAVFAQPESGEGQTQAVESAEDKAASDVAGEEHPSGEDGEEETTEPEAVPEAGPEGNAAIDMDSFTEALEIDYSQAAQLPLTGYFFKSIGEGGRQAKIYISEHASIRSYFTVIAVPDGVDAKAFVEEQGWFDVADANGECLLILEPGEGGSWGKEEDEIGYITDAIAFLKSGRNANNVTLFSNFGEFYFVGYGNGANPLMYYAMLNPIFIISQYYTNGAAANTKLMTEAGEKEYDGSNTSGYSSGYKDKDEEFNAVLKGLGITSRLRNYEIPVPTWLNKYSNNGATAKYWKYANDVYDNAVDNAFWQKPDAKRLATLYANACQVADGKNYGISQVKITQSAAGYDAGAIYDFLSLYTRYDNTFAYSNNLSWRLGYAPATVEAQINAQSGSSVTYTYKKTGGEEGEAVFLGDGSKAVTVPGTNEGGIVDVGVIAFADNSGDGNFDPREYIVYIPDSAKKWGEQGAPVVMLYPGNSQTDRIFMDSTAWWRVANKEGAVIAIVCETYNRGGVSVSHYNNDLFYYALKAHLEQYISAKFDVALDMGRIYGTGQSAGSMATQGFCFTHPEFFAAVASTSGINTNGGVNVSIPSYLISGQSDLNNLVPDMEGSTGLQTWANYLITANGANGSALSATKEYSESPYETMPGKSLLRWKTKGWSNDQGIFLVKWSQNILRTHNCYPAEMPMLFDFMKHFRYETDEDGYVTGRFYSESGFVKDDEVQIEFPELPTNDNIESIQAITDETFYGTGVIEVVVKYKYGTNLKNITPESYVLEDRGSLSPDYGQVKIESVSVDGSNAYLYINTSSQATENNKLVYTGSNKEGSRERNVFGIYCVGPWYRDVEGTIHYGSSDEDEYENNTTGQGYQARACLELRLRHVTDAPEDAACLADDKGQYAGEGSLWLPTIDRQFEEGGFRDLYGLKIRSTGQYDKTGIGDDYVRGYYYIPEDYDPANGIVFTLQGQGISYWQLADGTNNAGTGFMYDSATYSWRNKGAIVVNIHDRSTTSKLPEGYDFVVDDVNVMKYFIDTYQITGNIVIQGNSRGTMASDIVIKALAGCRYDPAQQGMGAAVELNKRLDKKVYDFTIDTYICQNGTMGGNMWEDDAWDAIVATGLKVWAFDGEQDSNNIDNIARLKELYRQAGKSEAWIDNNVRLTGYTSQLYYPWGESDHSTTRINGWYFANEAYYGPDLYIYPELGYIIYDTKLSDGKTYKLEGYGSAGENNKKDYEYTVYDELFQVWALTDTNEEPVQGVDLDSFTSALETDYSQAAQLPLTGYYTKSIDVDGNGELDDGREVKVYFSEETQIRSYFTIIAVPDGVDTYKFLEEEGWLEVADRQGEALFVLEPGDEGWGDAEAEEAYVNSAIAFLTGTRNANNVAVFSTFGEFYVAGYGEGAAPLEAWAAKNPILVIAQAYQDGLSAGTEYLTSIASEPYTGKSSNGDISDVLDETIEKVGISGVLYPRHVQIPTLLYNYSGSVDYWKIANYTAEEEGTDDKWPFAVKWSQDIDACAYSTDHANLRIRSMDEDAKYGISFVLEWITEEMDYIGAEQIYDGLFASFTRYDVTFAYSNVLSERLNYQEARVAAQRQAKDGVVKETLSDGTQIWGQADKVIDGHGTVQVGVIAFSDNNSDGNFDPREYLAFIPEGFEGQELPLLMVYAGNSQTDTIFMDSTLWWQIAEKEGIVLMFVCETYNNGGVTVSHYDSDKFYSALITLAKEQLDGKYADIDFTRIYGTGQSAGSNATQGFAITNPEMFAAVASTSGAPFSVSNGSGRQIPVMMISGQMDAGDMAKAFESSSLKAWGDYFLGVNDAGEGFAEDTADDVISGDSRHEKIYVWSNEQDIPMFSWGMCLLRPHNPYPSDGYYLWDFMSKYSFSTDEEGNIVRYYSPSGFKEDDAVLIADPQADMPNMSNVESIQAFTDETIYGMGVVEVVVTYKEGTNLSGITADSYILEDRGSLNPDFGQIKIADVNVDGRTVTLVISKESQATENNKLVYTGSDKEGSRERNAFGIYATNPWYRDTAGVIHYGKSDSDEYENNTSGQGYQTRASLELRLRHTGERLADAACLANDQGEYVGIGGLWLPTVDREFTEGGFKDLYDLKIMSTGRYDATGIGDKYVRGYYFIPENYDPANGIVFTIQGQGISYWQLEDGTNDAGTGFTYDSATYSWRNKGAIVVNIHDRSTTAKLPEGYDFVVDDVNVMKYFIDTYQITGNIVIQGNSRGTMASDIIIKALAGCLYSPSQQGMGATAVLNKRLDKKTYDFTIDTYICQNGTMGGNMWEDSAWKAIVATGLKVWAFDGEQDSNNIDNIARYKELCKEAGYSDEWIEENVRLTGYTSKLYYPWGESDHSTTRINGWYFSDAAYYGPDLEIDPETGEIVYNTRLSDGDKYKLTGYGSAGENNKKDYEYTVYDDLFQVWALEPAGDPAPVVPVDPTALEEFVTRLYANFLGREPDAAGLAAWVDALETGRATGAKVVSGFVLSQEFQNNPLDDEEYVTALYRIIFDREPDPQGLANWLSVLESGCTKKRVLSGFTNSDEFKALCEGLGIEAGTYKSDELPDLYPKVAGFVARLYTVCLERPYDQAGLNAWVTVLVTKEATGSKVARGFFNSKEFANRELSDEDFVRVAYRTILGREPEAGGFENWTNALANGLTRNEVIEGFLASEEFGNLCESYEIVR